MILTVLGSVWVASAVIAAPVFGRIPAHADRRNQMANVIPLFPARVLVPLPARLSPRAGFATSRAWKRLRRRLLGYGWLAGLLLAGVFCVAFTVLTRGHYVSWTGVHDIPTSAR